MLALPILTLYLANPAAAASPSGLRPDQETQRQYLSGTDKDHTVPWRFFCTAGAQSGYWTNIAVPSNWELKGFGTLSYQNDPTNVPVEQGKYEHTFTMPANWAGSRIFLVFEGVMTDTAATINGQPVGPVHQGSFYRFKYEVTKVVKTGETNRLEVTVAKYSANDGVNDAERRGDYWLFGGIFRPVFLEAVPMQFIERVAIDAQADGTFAMQVYGADNADGLTVVAQVFDLDGQPAGTEFAQEMREGKAVLKTQIAAPRQWTAETPSLYRVEVQLRQGSRVLHRIEQRFGFRTMEVRDSDGLYVNGRRVILKGCNRHSFWPDSGRCLSEAVHRMDIGLMKDINMNAVRMSHYPPDAQFLDLCDELGLYVLDELAGWHYQYDTQTGHKLVREMVTRDVNHPCILFWDNGNEGGWNTALDGDFAHWDPQQRRVLHPFARFGGLDTEHYRNYNQAAAICAGKMIYMPTEFLHGLYDGGAGAGMEDYWELMRRSPVLGGGFVWALLDEGVKRPDNGKIDVAGNRAPDGIVGPYREKEASYSTIKELWSPIVIKERTLPEKFDGTLTIENRYSVTDARQCKFSWQLRKFGGPDQKAGFTVVNEGQAPAPSIAPGNTGSLKLNLPTDWKKAEALSLSVSDQTGHELWTWVWPLVVAEEARTMVSKTDGHSATARETSDAIEVQAGGLKVSFDKRSVMLSTVSRDGKKFSFANGPRPAAGQAALLSFEHEAKGNDYELKARFNGDLETVRWLVHGNGWVQCDYTYAAAGARNFMGVVFDYPENLVKHKKWLGDGPYRVWKNRLSGVTLNVWENDYNNTQTGFTDWVYPEFKGCFANVRWLQLETAEGPITVVLGRDDQFVQVQTPEFPTAKLQKKAKVLLPRCGLAFLDAIPAIGNKFSTAEDTGPQGKPNLAEGSYSGSVSFYFGDLKRN